MILTYLKKYLKTFKYIRILSYKLNKNYTNLNKLNLNKDSVVIDLGANIGIISQLIEDKYDCYIDCYEPNQYAFKELQKRFKNNKKINCYNDAVTEKDGEEKIYYHNNSEIDQLKWSTGTSLLIDKSNVDPLNFKIIKTKSINNIIEKFEVIDLIKIDIEGYEYKIISELIKNKNKIKKVICELHGNPITNKDQFLNKDHEELIIKLKELQLYDDWFVEHF
tara:strand:+ start:163 stop:825 length:663 start_codon:yes stop_codon:yes gene_type:complete